MQGIQEKAKWHIVWTIRKYRGDFKEEAEAVAAGVRPYAEERFEQNLLLNEGIAEMLNLLIGGTATAYNNANSRVGVGDSSAVAAATQTALQGASTAFAAMDTNFPSIAGQTVTFKGTFGTAAANFAWNEFTADNGAVANKNLNRKVEAKGTKVSGETWVLQIDITIS